MLIPSRMLSFASGRRARFWATTFFIILILECGSAYAGFSCSGVLTQSQQEGFMKLFSPEYSPNLVQIGEPLSPANMFKQLSPEDLKRLSSSKPTVAAQDTLSDEHAAVLKGWLNEDVQSSIPGWLSTAIGVLVPEAWVGLSADVFIQLVNQQGDAGRVSAANIAGTVSQGGTVGVIEQVSKQGDSNKFVWAYIYMATLNNKTITMPLTVCSADIANQAAGAERTR